MTSSSENQPAAHPLCALIVTALHAEARPLIDAYGMKRDPSTQAFETYLGDETALVVTGVGKVRSAMATAAFLSSHPVTGLTAVNVGIAGAAPGSGWDIGELFLIHKILDASTGKEQFPDLLVRSPLRECALLTVDRQIGRAHV